MNPNNEAPPLPSGPRPLIQHTAVNGRHSSATSRSPLPPPPIARPANTHISAPPTQNRSISPASPPLSRDSGPPLPDRRLPSSSSHKPNARRDPPPRTPSNVTTVEEAEPQRDNSSPVLPPRQVGTSARSNPPLPPTRPGSQRAASTSTSSRSDSKSSRADSKVGRPPPGGNRPRPSLPSRPKPELPSGKPTKPSARGGGGTGGIPNIPTGEGMTPREMIDVAQKEIPNLLGAVSNRNSGVPKCLGNLCTLSENIADQARCSGIKYRFAMTNLRSNVGTLRESSHASWHTNADRIAEILKSILGHMESLSKDLVE